jgi:protein-S-isoprenylcysteine O-methyltransferase Ste14
MKKNKQHGLQRNVRSSVKKDMIQFALPGIIVLATEVALLAVDGLVGFWQAMGRVIVHPTSIVEMSAHAASGMLLFVIGLTIMCWGQVTLFRNYSGTVVIHEGHELVTHGIYRYVRNPMYLGMIIALIIGLPLYVASLRALLVSLLLIPILLNRIRLEEELLTDYFGEKYLDYKRKTKRIIPGVC